MAGTPIPPGEIVYWFRVAGVGIVIGASANRQYYFATSKPGFDVDDAFLPYLRRDDPPSYTETVNERTGSTIVSSMVFSVLFEDEVLNSLCNLRPQAIGTLTETLSISASTVKITATGRTNEIIYLGREAIQLGTVEAPAGEYIGSVRGALGTSREQHLFDTGDIQVFEDFAAPVGQLVEFGVSDELASAYGSEAPVWAGVFNDNGSEDGGVTLQNELTGALALLVNARVYPSPWQGRIFSVGSGALIFATVVFLPARNYEGPTQWPWSVGGNAPSEGDRVWLKVRDSAYEAVWTITTGLGGIWRFEIDNPLPGLEPTKPEPGDVVSEIFSSDPRSPGDSPGDLNSLPLGGSNGVDQFPDMLSILLQLLTSKDGSNGAYDLGVNLGIAIDYTLVDIDGIELLQSTHQATMRMDSFYLGIDARGKDSSGGLALPFISRRLLAPFGCVFAHTATGLLTVKKFDRLPPLGASLVTLTDDDLLAGTIIESNNGWQRTVDRVEVSFFQLADGSVIQYNHNDMDTRERKKPHQSSALKYEAHGVKLSRAVNIIALDRLFAFRDPRPDFQFQTTFDFNVLPGEPFRVTTNQLVGVDSDGKATRGVEEVLCYVNSQAVAPLSGIFSYRATVVDIAKSNLGYFAPGLEVADSWTYTPATGVVKYTANKYQSPTASGYLYDNDGEPFEAGWYMGHYDEFFEEIDLDLVIGSVNTGTSEVTFSTYPAAWDAGFPPVSGDIFVSSKWDSQLTANQKLRVHLSDNNNELGPDDDPGFLYAW